MKKSNVDLFYECPICKKKARLLRGDRKRRYFCNVCCVEIKVEQNKVSIFNILHNGDEKELKQIKRC